MLDLNIVNFITVALIAVIAITLIRTVAKAVGKTSPV